MKSKLRVFFILSSISTFCFSLNAQTQLPAPFGVVIGYNSTGQYFTVVVGAPNPDNKVGLRAYVFAQGSSGNIGDQVFSEVVSGGKLTYNVPGTYTLKMQAIGDGTNFSDSPLSAASTWVIPSGPAVQLATPTITSITNGIISFNSVSGAANYTVFVYSSGNSTPVATQDNINSGDLIRFNTPGTYSVQLRANGSLPYSTNSELSTAVSWTINQLVAIKLNTPFGVTGGYSSTPKLLNCGWGNGDSNASGYRRYIYEIGNDITPVTVIYTSGGGQGDIPGFTPTPGKSYRLKIQAVGNGSTYSDSDLSGFGATITIPGTTPPAVLAPTNLAVDQKNCLTFTPSTNATGYVAYVYKGLLLCNTQPNFTSGDPIIYTGNPGPYTLKVRALGDGINYDNSIVSIGTSWTIPGNIGATAYCNYLMGTTNAQYALITFETNSAGNVVITIGPYNGDANTAFRNSGWADALIQQMTVNGDPNTNYKYFTRTMSADKLHITFNVVSGMINPGDIISIPNLILEYKTTLDGNLYPSYTFSYIYGTTANYFRTKASGDLNSTTTWQISSDNTTWTDANSIPNSGVGYVSVSSGNLLSISNDETFSNLIINPGGKVTLSSGKTLNITNLNINSDATGTGTYIDYGTTNATYANVQQYLTSGRNWYISSPVSSATTGALSSTASVVEYNETTGNWDPASGTLNPLRGYISTSTTTTGTVTFSGILNTGAQTTDVGGQPTLTRTGTGAQAGFNLVGNPYPSYIDWNAATKNNLETTFWYRTKTAPVNGLTSYVFDTFNATGDQHTNLGATTVSNLIPPMQAFWVRVANGFTSGTLAFTNDMRSHADVSGNTMKAPSNVNERQQVLHLQVSNGVNKDEAILYSDPNASNGFDNYDSPKMSNDNASIPEIFTNIGNEQLVINGMNSLPLNTEIPLGFTTKTSNTFTIRASEIKNLDPTIKVILKDKQNVTNPEQDITDGSAYSFSTDATSWDKRFSILFKTTSNTTGITTHENNAMNILVSKNAENQIEIKLSEKRNGMVSIYNTIGQNLYRTKLTGTTTIINTSIGSGVYFIKIDVGGVVTTKKIFL